MPFLRATELDQHLEADATFGPCLRPDCPNYAASNIAAMGQLEDIANGIQLAKDVAVTTSEGDEQAVLDLINDSTPGALANAVAYLGGMVSSSFTELAGGDVAHGQEMLRNACGESDDVLDSQARLLAHEYGTGD